MRIKRQSITFGELIGKSRVPQIRLNRRFNERECLGYSNAYPRTLKDLHGRKITDIKGGIDICLHSIRQ